MYIFRFAAAIVGFLLAILVSWLSGIELFKVFALMGFVLVIDTIAVRTLANLYMQAVYKEMEKTAPREKKDEKNDTSSR